MFDAAPETLYTYVQELVDRKPVIDYPYSSKVEYILERISRLVERFNIKYSCKPLSLYIRGYSEVDFRCSSKVIVINTLYPMSSRVATCIHELVHTFYHQDQVDTSTYDSPSRIQKEVDAESTTYVLCRVYGIASPQNYYRSGGPYKAQYDNSFCDYINCYQQYSYVPIFPKITVEMALKIHGYLMQES